jgi:hypothetical protein
VPWRARPGVAGVDATEMALFAHASGRTDVYRSILYFEHHRTPAPRRTVGWSGPVAIEHYLAAETKGRLIQSLKSFLTSRSLTATDVFGRRHTIEALIARLNSLLRCFSRVILESRPEGSLLFAGMIRGTIPRYDRAQRRAVHVIRCFGRG